MAIEEEIKKRIEDHISKLKSHKAKHYLRHDLLYPMRERKKDLLEIQKRVSELKPLYELVKAEVAEFKKLIGDITDQTVMCAAYLIYGKVIQSWDSLFSLAMQGKNIPMMMLVRSIEEDLDLIKTFYIDKTQKQLNRWFDGEVIRHKISREHENDWLVQGGNKAITERNISPYDLATDVYNVLSQYTHCSYITLLENIDVFVEDFDWSGNAGAHYARTNMRAVKGAMVSTLTTLKMTYLELKDPIGFEKVNKALVAFAGPMDETTLNNLMDEIDGKAGNN